jgi:hypothetical protein
MGYEIQQRSTAFFNHPPILCLEYALSPILNASGKVVDSSTPPFNTEKPAEFPPPAL